MKLKEAQMLGILALIAVAVILLCVWGGGGSATKEQEATVSELVNQIRGDLLEPGTTSGPAVTEDYPGSPAAGADEAPPPEESRAEIHAGPPAAGVAVPPDEGERIVQDVQPPGLAEAVEPPETAAPAPAAATPPPAPSAPRPKALTHVVERGETLWGISRKYYNDASKWQAILDANRAVLRGPADLRPGMRLTVPPLAAETRATASSAAGGRTLSASLPGARTHTVKKGDTLFRIALKYYGDGSRWREILAANRAVLKDPRDLKPGMKLTVP